MTFAAIGAIGAVVVAGLIANSGWEIKWGTNALWLVAIFPGAFLALMLLVITPYRMWSSQRSVIADQLAQIKQLQSTPRAPDALASSRMELWRATAALRATIHRRGFGPGDRWDGVEDEFFSVRATALAALETLRLDQALYAAGHDAIHQCSIALQQKRESDAEGLAESQTEFSRSAVNLWEEIQRAGG